MAAHLELCDVCAVATTGVVVTAKQVPPTTAAPLAGLGWAGLGWDPFPGILVLVTSHLKHGAN